MSTPLRAQYLRLKQPFPDALLLFRLGDFYELYDEDACVAARELGLTLTTREFTGDKRIPMCPLPYHGARRARGRPRRHPGVGDRGASSPAVRTH